MDPNRTIVNEADHVLDNRNNSGGIDLSSPVQKDTATSDTGITKLKPEVSHNFTITICKKLKISICKPLITLKIALFLWYGGGDAFSTFLMVFLKQRGITLGELSTVYVIAPVFQILGPTVSGIIADKIGRSKPVLVVNLLLVFAAVLGLLIAPSLNANCDPQPNNLKCHPQEMGHLIVETSCDRTMDVIELSFCNVACPENVTHYCDGQNLICELLEENGSFDNFSLSVHVDWAYKLKRKCYYNVTSMSYKNVTYSWCNVPNQTYCRISCFKNFVDNCSDYQSSRTKILIFYLALIVLFFVSFSNCFRFMEITSMSLVQDHGSHFGRERFFAIVGVLICSPLVGYIIDKTTAERTEKNYSVAFLFFICIMFLLLIVIYKLEVRIESPGKNMWRKSLYLLKNPDVIAFILVLIVLGTFWGFGRNFTTWYLEGMKAPSFLLGLLSAFNSLYGLPFLFTSHWWVKKIGATQIFTLGLLGYVASGIGYSLLYEPKLALLIEATSIVTYHLLWVAVIVHSHGIAPDGLIATVLTTSGAIHYSIGKCSGGLFGGLIMNTFGGRVAYRVMAVICFSFAILYSAYLYIRKIYFPRSHPLDIRNNPVTYGNQSFSRETCMTESSLEMK